MRAKATAVAAAALFLAFAGPAFAHVEVAPDTAAVGADQTINVRVPNEIDGARTVKVEFDLPTDASGAGPISSVLVEPLPGWTVTEQKTHLPAAITTNSGQVTDVVSQIVWTAAAGGGISTGQYQLFPILMSIPAKGTQIVFKAIQTYDNGTVVRWIDPPNPDGSEPDHPTPILKLTAAETNAPPATVDLSKVAKKSAVTTADVLGIAGIVVGALGLFIGVAALVARRR